MDDGKLPPLGQHEPMHRSFPLRVIVRSTVGRRLVQ